MHLGFLPWLCRLAALRVLGTHPGKAGGHTYLFIAPCACPVPLLRPGLIRTVTWTVTYGHWGGHLESTARFPGPCLGQARFARLAWKQQRVTAEISENSWKRTERSEWGRRVVPAPKDPDQGRRSGLNGANLPTTKVALVFLSFLQRCPEAELLTGPGAKGSSSLPSHYADPVRYRWPNSHQSLVLECQVPHT